MSDFNPSQDLIKLAEKISLQQLYITHLGMSDPGFKTEDRIKLQASLKIHQDYLIKLEKDYRILLEKELCLKQ